MLVVVCFVFCVLCLLAYVLFLFIFSNQLDKEQKANFATLQIKSHRKNNQKLFHVRAWNDSYRTDVELPTPLQVLT